MRSRLIIGESLFAPGGAVPPAYVGLVEFNLLAEHPDVGAVTIAEERLPADDMSPEPYALLTATGEVPDA